MPENPPRMCGLGSWELPPARLGLKRSLLRSDGGGGGRFVHEVVRVAACGGGLLVEEVTNPAKRAAAGEYAHGGGEEPRDHVREHVGLGLQVEDRLCGRDGNPGRGAQGSVHPAFTGVARAKGHARIVHASAGHLDPLREPQRGCCLRGQRANDGRGGDNLREKRFLQAAGPDELGAVPPGQQVIDAASRGVGKVGQHAAGQAEVHPVL